MNAPSPTRESPAAPLGPVGMARWAWRQLTSMRTALFLLLLLAVAAVPGSIFPQRSLDQTRVSTYLTDHPGVGPWLDRLGLFDVFSSPWFSAIYLLLVVSLIGCVLPRTKLHWHALRSQPPRAPLRLERLPSHGEALVDASVEQAWERARAGLGRRYRVRRDSGVSDGQGVLAAEQGYLRETGNLVFHAALLLLIAAVAWGHLVGWKADRIVPVGQSFTNTFGSYDSYSPGPWVDPAALQPFSVRVDSLDVRYETSTNAGNQLGAPRDFRVRTTITDRPGAAPRSEILGVNKPLTFGGTSVYLLGNGYAPTVTVRDAAGEVLYRQATPFLPVNGDANYTSTGTVKVPGAAPKQLGLTGYFLPTGYADADGWRSVFPDLTNPVLVLSAYEGTLFGRGGAQSVFTLDTSAMEQVRDDAGQPLRLTLTRGQTVQLPGGRGSVTFDTVDRWAGVSTRYDPAKPFALVSAVLMALGLVGSLLVRRRRVFVRISPQVGPDGRAQARVRVGALAKGEDPLLDQAVADLLEAIATGDPRARQGGSPQAAGLSDPAARLAEDSRRGARG